MPEHASGRVFAFDHSEGRHGLVITARQRNIRITAPPNATEQSLSALKGAAREWCEARDMPDNVRLTMPTRTVALELPDTGDTDTVLALSQFLTDRLDAWEQGRERRNDRAVGDEDADEAPLHAPTG